MKNMLNIEELYSSQFMYEMHFLCIFELYVILFEPTQHRTLLIISTWFDWQHQKRSHCGKIVSIGDRVGTAWVFYELKACHWLMTSKSTSALETGVGGRDELDLKSGLLWVFCAVKQIFFLLIGSAWQFGSHLGRLRFDCLCPHWRWCRQDEP